MDRYAADGQIAIVTPAPGDTALAVFASALTRAQIYQFILSITGAGVADNVIEWLVRRLTAAGTSTAVPPAPLDFSAPPSQLAAGENFTVEPTYTAPLLDPAVHQRSVYTWNAQPNGALKIPAVAGSGIGFTPIHAAYNQSADVTAHWQE